MAEIIKIIGRADFNKLEIRAADGKIGYRRIPCDGYILYGDKIKLIKRVKYKRR